MDWAPREACWPRRDDTPSRHHEVWRGETMNTLRSKRALVTGASSGIGQAIAVRFGEQGAFVAVGGRDEARIEATCRAVETAGGRAVGVPGDVSKADDASSVVDAAVAAMGGLDIVVNDAGIDANEWHDVADFPIDVFDEIMAVNTRGPFPIPKFSPPPPPARRRWRFDAAHQLGVRPDSVGRRQRVWHF